MKKIYSAGNEIDAHLAKSFLDEAGIESVVQSAALSNVIGEIPVNDSTLPSLWVRDDDVDAAMSALENFKSPPAAQGEPWKCSKCGEMSEPQFTACWSCGESRVAETSG